MNLDDYNIHVIASVLKQWLRDLPSPLMTFELYEEFLRAMGKASTWPLLFLSDVHLLCRSPTGVDPGAFQCGGAVWSGVQRVSQPKGFLI